MLASCRFSTGANTGWTATSEQGAPRRIRKPASWGTKGTGCGGGSRCSVYTSTTCTTTPCVARYRLANCSQTLRRFTTRSCTSKTVARAVWRSSTWLWPYSRGEVRFSSFFYLNSIHFVLWRTMFSYARTNVFRYVYCAHWQMSDWCVTYPEFRSMIP